MHIALRTQILPFASITDSYASNPEALRTLFGFLGEAFEAEEITAVLANRLSH